MVTYIYVSCEKVNVNVFSLAIFKYITSIDIYDTTSQTQFKSWELKKHSFV